MREQKTCEILEERKASVFILTDPTFVCNLCPVVQPHAGWLQSSRKNRPSGWPKEHKTPCWNRKNATFSIISNPRTLAGHKCSGWKWKVIKWKLILLCDLREHWSDWSGRGSYSPKKVWNVTLPCGFLTNIIFFNTFIDRSLWIFARPLNVFQFLQKINAKLVLQLYHWLSCPNIGSGWGASEA